MHKKSENSIFGMKFENIKSRELTPVNRKRAGISTLTKFFPKKTRDRRRLRKNFKGTKMLL